MRSNYGLTPSLCFATWCRRILSSLGPTLTHQYRKQNNIARSLTIVKSHWAEETLDWLRCQDPGSVRDLSSRHAAVLWTLDGVGRVLRHFITFLRSQSKLLQLNCVKIPNASLFCFRLTHLVFSVQGNVTVAAKLPTSIRQKFQGKLSLNKVTQCVTSWLHEGLGQTEHEM